MPQLDTHPPILGFLEADVKPGEGRMQECLESKHAYLNSMCSSRRTRADRVPNVCKEDVDALCPKDVGDEAHHLVCLRKHRNKITQKCWDELSELGSDGWEVLPHRFKQMGVDTECSAALIRLCSDVAPGYGALHQCVDRNWDELAKDCGLRRRVVPERVPPACEHDALLLCKHVIAGDNRVHECLWKYDGVRNSDGKTLSKDCLSSIILESHGMDVECSADMTELCGHDRRGKHDLVRCLHSHQERLAPGCTTRKHLHVIDETHAKQAPTYHNLHTGTHADGCADDIRRLCRCIRRARGADRQRALCRYPVVPRHDGALLR